MTMEAERVDLMIVELRGGQFVNQGAHLMLRAVIERLRKARPQAQIAMAPSPWASPADRDAVGALLKFPLRKRAVDLNGLSDWWPASIDRWLVGRGVVTESGVDAVLDLSGYAYGDRWGARSLFAAAAELHRFHRRGRPYVFLPQAFGPFVATHDAAHAFGSALRHAALVCPRDAESEDALRRVAHEGCAPIERFPDFTIGLAGAPEAAGDHGIDRATVLLIPNVRMLDSPSVAGPWAKEYVASIANLASVARGEGLVPCVLNHAGREDTAICARLVERCRALGFEVRVVDERDPVRVKGLIGAAGLVISSRFHGCVSAMSQAVPCLATAWSHKYSELFSEFGCPEAVLQGPNLDEGAARLRRVLRHSSEIQAELRMRATAMSVCVETMWARVFLTLPKN